jgi:hypothetical protein
MRPEAVKKLCARKFFFQGASISDRSILSWISEDATGRQARVQSSITPGETIETLSRIPEKVLPRHKSPGSSILRVRFRLLRICSSDRFGLGENLQFHSFNAFRI